MQDQTNAKAATSTPDDRSIWLLLHDHNHAHPDRHSDFIDAAMEKARQLPADWTRDSSLEAWFPQTAQRLAEAERLAEHYAKQRDELNAELSEFKRGYGGLLIAFREAFERAEKTEEVFRAQTVMWENALKQRSALLQRLHEASLFLEKLACNRLNASEPMIPVDDIMGEVDSIRTAVARIHDQPSEQVICIGRNGNNGCDYLGGKSGDTCPKCGGMLLAKQSITAADKAAESWEGNDYRQLQQQLEAIKARCERLGKDEARLDWLEKNWGTFDPLGAEVSYPLPANGLLRPVIDSKMETHAPAHQ